MEIKKKQVIKEYWDCGLVAHRHKKKDTAIRCIEKQRKARAEPQNISSCRTVLRNATIFERLVFSGEKSADLAKEYGLARGTIWQTTRQLGTFWLFKRGEITEEQMWRRLPEWKKKKDEAKDFIRKIKENANAKLKSYGTQG